MKPKLILALDQGTSSSRTIAYDVFGREVAKASRELRCSYPQNGWVEQDPLEIWETQNQSLLEVCGEICLADVVAIGITNQRETVLGWHRDSGNPVTPAIVWQCRRTSQICQTLKANGLEPLFRGATGLLLDPYFSGTKISWLLDNLPNLRAGVVSGEIVFGTIDSWILFKLTREFGTETTNASRTLLMNLQNCTWDQRLFTELNIPKDALPPIKSSVAAHGVARILGAEIPVTAMLGDQQASLLGHGCFAAGQSKCTFGTGAFLLAHTGSALIEPSAGILATSALTLPQAASCSTGKDGALTVEGQSRAYAMEGSIFIAGALIQWLRDKLGVIGSASESERVAREVKDSAGVILVPAFVGLGAPYWDADARAAIFNLTRESSAVHIVRAALDAVAHQVADLLSAPEFSAVQEIRIDGGMSRNSLFCEILANLTAKNVIRCPSSELTARGVAILAGLGAGLWSSLSEAVEVFSETKEEIIYRPTMSQLELIDARARWSECVSAVIGRGSRAKSVFQS